MANYRPCSVAIWKDPDFEEFSKDQKLLFVYLFTNESTTESGIYPLTIRTMSNETGIGQDTIKQILENGLKNIGYDFENKCVFVVNFLKHNGRGRKDLVQASIENDYTKNPTSQFWYFFKKIYPAYSEFINIDTSIPISISNSISISISIYDFYEVINKSLPRLKQDLNKEKKYKHLEYIYLKEGEYDRLVNDYGLANTEKMIAKLDNYIGQNPKKNVKKYTDHNRVLRGWVAETLGVQTIDRQNVSKGHVNTFLESLQQEG